MKRRAKIGKEGGTRKRNVATSKAALVNEAVVQHRNIAPRTLTGRRGRLWHGEKFTSADGPKAEAGGMAARPGPVKRRAHGLSA